MKKSFFMICAVLVAIAGCTGSGGKSDGAAKHEPEPTDTVYTQQAAMDIYGYDPVRALLIVDSAVIVGNLSPWRADKNRMRIYGQTVAAKRLDSLMHWTAGTRFDTVRAIGERLLRHDSIRNSLAGQLDVLEMMVIAARQQADTAARLRYSEQLVDVCRRYGSETEALRTEAEVGATLCSMGRQAEGQAMLDSVITNLECRMEGGKFNELDALVIVLKRKISVLTAAGQSAEALPLARRIVMLMDDYAAHPDQYHDGTYHEPPAENRDDYIRFYRTQAENFIAAAYADLGKKKDLETTFERLESITRDAATREHLARYNALQQQLQRQAAEARAERQQARANSIRLQAVGLFVITLLAISFAVILYRKNRDIRQKNRVLAQQLTELYDNTRPAAAEEAPGSEAPESEEPEEWSAEETYRHIRDEVLRLQLYTDPGFGRQSVIERYHLTKDQAGRVFSQGSEHASISDFITECRLDHARRLLVSRPDMSIADIAAASGFGVRTTFTRSFKAKHGLTPTEFREQQR